MKIQIFFSEFCSLMYTTMNVHQVSRLMYLMHRHVDFANFIKTKSWGQAQS